MQSLHQFTRIGKQRATLLKQLGASANTGQPVDAVLSGLEIWTGQFIEAGVETDPYACESHRLAG